MRGAIVLLLVLCGGCVNCAPARECRVTLNEVCVERGFAAGWIPS